MPSSNQRSKTSSKGTKARRGAAKPTRGAAATTQPPSGTRSGLRTRTGTPLRNIQRELEIAEGEESAPQDSDTDSDVGSLNTRGGGGRFVSSVPVEPMTEVSVKEAERLRTALQQNQEVIGSDAKPWDYLTGDARDALHIRWEANQDTLPQNLRKEPAQYNRDEFVQVINLLYTNISRPATESAQTRIEQNFATLPITYTNYVKVESACLSSRKLIEVNVMPEPQQATTIQRIAKTSLSFSRDKPYADETKKVFEAVKASTQNFTEWSGMLLKTLVTTRNKVKELSDLGVHIDAIPYKSTMGKRDLGGNSKANDPKRPKTDQKSTTLDCNACGRANHIADDCRFSKQGHPDANKQTNIPWAQSKNGLAWKEKGKDCLPGNMTLSGKPFQFAPEPRKQGKHYLNATRSFTAEGHTLKCGIIINDSHPIHREIDCLIDTGALTLNYISRNVAKWLTSHGTTVDRVTGDRCIEV